MRAILIGVALAAGCVPPQSAFRPVSVKAPDDAFGRAMRGVVLAGNAVETSDEKSGVITTKWEEQHATMDIWWRFRWTVMVGGGLLTVASQCQMRNADPGPGGDKGWRDCEQQPTERGSKAKSLTDTILAQPASVGQPASTTAQPATEPAAEAKPSEETR
jgi:hypothetical protein